jgi:hypothetical protein
LFRAKASLRRSLQSPTGCFFYPVAFQSKAGFTAENTISSCSRDATFFGADHMLFVDGSRP